jgi:hypothetical protein
MMMAIESKEQIDATNKVMRDNFANAMEVWENAPLASRGPKPKMK